MIALPVCIYVHHLPVCSPKRPEEGTGTQEVKLEKSMI